MQAAWRHLVLDPEFMHAYQHGFVVKCSDGVTRRVFPRFVSYTADYPEKYVSQLHVLHINTYFRMLLATLRDNGTCPCPRCLVKKDEADGLGTSRDREIRTTQRRCDTRTRQHAVALAKRLIAKGKGIESKPVERLLKPESLVPTEVRSVDLQSATLLIKG